MPSGDASDAELRDLIASLINSSAAAPPHVAKPQTTPFPENQLAPGAAAVELLRRAGAQTTSVDLRKTWIKRAMDISGQLGLARQKNAMSVDNSQENCRKLVEHCFAGRIWLDAFTQRILTTIDWSRC